jgi:hypothetical protein
MIQNMLESTSDELGSIDAPRRSREWLIAALFVLAVATCWISWRAGSPALDRVRYEATRQGAQLSKLRLPGSPPKGGPEQRIGPP